MARFDWKYPEWITPSFQERFESEADELLAAKTSGTYRVYIPYYAYSKGRCILNAPTERRLADGSWVPNVIFLDKFRELILGQLAHKVGEVIVSHRHRCIRCGHCILDHTILNWPKAEQWVAEWHVCHCGCAFYTEEVFALNDCCKKS